VPVEMQSKLTERAPTETFLDDGLNARCAKHMPTRQSHVVLVCDVFGTHVIKATETTQLTLTCVRDVPYISRWKKKWMGGGGSSCDGVRVGCFAGAGGGGGGGGDGS
jgi:hypothetical protein